MKAEEAKKIADQALQQLAASLAAGKSDALREYLAMLARFHNYSFGNVMMILSQRRNATHVAGFHAWLRLGRYVKKGEKGIVILAPMILRNRDTAATENEPEAADKTGKKRLWFRAVYVFDVSQTDGQPLPEPASVQGEPGERLALLTAHIAAHGITIDNDDIPFGAEGVSRGGRISVRSDLTAAQEFAVLIHEFAHELLHRGHDRPPTTTARETEAEAIAFVVCYAAGLVTITASSDYILLYNGKVETLQASLSRIQRTASNILVAITPERDEAAFSSEIDRSDISLEERVTPLSLAKIRIR